MIHLFVLVWWLIGFFSFNIGLYYDGWSGRITVGDLFLSLVMAFTGVLMLIFVLAHFEVHKKLGWDKVVFQRKKK